MICKEVLFFLGQVLPDCIFVLVLLPRVDLSAGEINSATLVILRTLAN